WNLARQPAARVRVRGGMGAVSLWKRRRSLNCAARIPRANEKHSRRCAHRGIPRGLDMQLPKLTSPEPTQTPGFASGVYWGVKNPERFNELIAEAIQLVEPGYYFGDNLFTWCRNISAFDDPVFLKVWK